MASLRYALLATAYRADVRTGATKAMEFKN